MWLNGRWFLQIVDRGSGNLYPIYPLFPCSDFVSQGSGVVVRGVKKFHFMFSSLFVLFPTYLEKNSFSFCVFFTFYAISNILEENKFQVVGGGECFLTKKISFHVFSRFMLFSNIF